MQVSPRTVVRVFALGLMLALMVPAIAFGQSQNGTTGNGNGSQSGDVANNQTNSQTAAGSNNNLNQTNQNCVAGRDCVNNNITNQNSSAAPAPRVFERTPVRVRVRRVRLARTGSDLTALFVLGGLATAGGMALLVGTRRRSRATV